MKMPIGLFILVALLVAIGCGNVEETVEETSDSGDLFVGGLSLEEKQDLLDAELIARQVEDIDPSLTGLLLAEEEIKIAYVKDQGNVVVAYLTFLPGVSEEAVDRISDRAWNLIKEEYPDRNINVSGEIAEE